MGAHFLFKIFLNLSLLLAFVHEVGTGGRRVCHGLHEEVRSHFVEHVFSCLHMVSEV